MSACERGISVVVSTYDERRWNDLVACLASLEAQTRPPGEVLVVIDHNDDLLAKVSERFPDVKAIPNRRLRGLAGARNTGTDVALGDIVAFIDDDARAEPEWLRHVESCFDESRVVGVGGALLPLWQTARPDWLPSEFYWVIGCSYEGLPARRAPIRNPIGANMAVRMSALAEVGGFREGDGADAPREIRSRGVVRAAGNVPDDTDLAIRVTQRMPEAVWLYEPAARVLHSVTAERATLGYFVRRCFEEGVGKANLAGYVGTADALGPERRHVATTLPRAVINELRCALRGERTAALRAGTIALGTCTVLAGFTVSRMRPGLRPQTVA